MINNVRNVLHCSTRTFKNFGHKRQPIPSVTVLWQGFLTFTFIGLGLNWKAIGRLVFGDDSVEEVPWKRAEKPAAVDS